MPEDTTRPTRRQPKQRRAQQTIEVVLQGAVKVLAREGASSVTTNRIAEAAGVSIGSLYQYFPDKYAIFGALHDAHAECIQRMIARTLEAHATTPVEPLLLALLDGLIDQHAADPVPLHELFVEFPQPPSDEPGLREALRQIVTARALELGARARGAQFVVPTLMDLLVHEAVLSRPAGLSLADAKGKAARAVVSCLAA